MALDRQRVAWSRGIERKVEGIAVATAETESSTYYSIYRNVQFQDVLHLLSHAPVNDAT
jgi:hypothetical protein